MSHLPTKTVAAFDFDGTLTYRDTLLPFLTYCLGWRRLVFKLIYMVPWVLAFFGGLKSRQEVKEALLMRCFATWPPETVYVKGIEFAKFKIGELLKPAALERLRWHQRQNHRCILISANLSVYLAPFAKSMGFDDIISSELAAPGPGQPFGRLSGKNCWGPEKVRRLEALLGKKDYILYAYGDSLGDKELLGYADCAFYRRFT